MGETVQYLVIGLLVLFVGLPMLTLTVWIVLMTVLHLAPSGLVTRLLPRNSEWSYSSKWDEWTVAVGNRRGNGSGLFRGDAFAAVVFTAWMLKVRSAGDAGHTSPCVICGRPSNVGHLLCSSWECDRRMRAARREVDQAADGVL